MKTIKKHIPEPSSFFILIFLGMSLLFQATLCSQTAGGTPRFAISAAAGIFRPGQGSFRGLYGSTQVPLHVQIQFRFLKGWAVFAGFRYAEASGKTLIVGPQYVEESHTIKFSMSSIRLGVQYSLAAGRVRLFVGAGASYNLYKEKWEDAGLSTEGKRTGLLADAGAEYLFSRWFSIFIRGEYSTIPTGQGAALEKKVDLGGIEGVIGISFKF